MKVFRNYTFGWWQMALFKVCLLAIGVAIGSYWHEIFSQCIPVLVIGGIVIGIYLAVISFKQ